MNTKTNKLPRPFRPALHKKNWLAGMELNACAAHLHKAQNAVLDAEGQAFDIAIDNTPGAAYSIHAAASVNARINGAKANLRDMKQSAGLR